MCLLAIYINISSVEKCSLLCSFFMRWGFLFSNWLLKLPGNFPSFSIKRHRSRHTAGCHHAGQRSQPHTAHPAHGVSGARGVVGAGRPSQLPRPCAPTLRLRVWLLSPSAGARPAKHAPQVLTSLCFPPISASGPNLALFSSALPEKCQVSPLKRIL